MLGTYILDGLDVFDQLGAVKRSGVIGAISWHGGGDVGKKFVEEGDFEDLVVSQKLQGDGCILAQGGGETVSWKRTAGQFRNAEQLSIVGIGEAIRQWEGGCDRSDGEGDDCEEKHDEGFEVR